MAIFTIEKIQLTLPLRLLGFIQLSQTTYVQPAIKTGRWLILECGVPKRSSPVTRLTLISAGFNYTYNTFVTTNPPLKVEYRILPNHVARYQNGSLKHSLSYTSNGNNRVSEPHYFYSANTSNIPAEFMDNR